MQDLTDICKYMYIGEKWREKKTEYNLTKQ